MSLPQPIRWMLIVVTSIGLQLCCCNFRSLLPDCCSGGGSESNELLATAAHLQAPCHGEHAVCHADLDDSHTPAQNNQSPHTPCDQQQGGCPCGTHDKAPDLVGKPKFDISVAAIAILPLQTFSIGGQLNNAARYVESRAVLPPATSLLGQHCALVV